MLKLRIQTAMLSSEASVASAPISSLTQFIEQLACKSRLLYKLCRLYYQGIIKREIALADISSADHVLFIGGGPCPFSAIMIHQMTGARVTVIDHDHDCVLAARKLVSRMGYDEQISLYCKNGCELPEYESIQYTIIHMAAQLSPLEHVFNHIKKHSQSGTKILVRLPKESIKQLYCHTKCSLFMRCPRTLHSTMNNLESTALYVNTKKTL